jgi:UDP-N-acetylmuramoylalanine--D-glutamate ligase
MFSVDGQRVVVVGAARSGIAAAELLASRGADVILTDLRPALEPEHDIKLREAGVQLELGGHRAETLRGADLIVLSPGVSPAQPDVAAARAADIPVIGELELASRWLRGRIVAVTGTKGKSTTTTLIGRMLEAAGMQVLVGGNIGVPLSAQVARSTPDVIHVVEASSFQLEMTEQFRPDIAVLLNFSPDHLDRHATVEEYAEAKQRIFANQREQDWAVINVDDPEAVRLASVTRAKTVPISQGGNLENALREGVVISGDTIVHRGKDGQEWPLLPLSSVHLLGRHLLTDVLAAAAVAEILGVAPAAMRGAVEGFTGLEHALEPVRTIAGVRFVNDSKATNVEAAERSIESFDRDLAVIMGGRYKGGDFGRLREPLRARGAMVVAIGEAKPQLREALGDTIVIRDAATMSEAVRLGFASVRPGGTVLLAPACSSFDMFRDYADRGRQFKDAVAALGAEVERTREQ